MQGENETTRTNRKNKKYEKMKNMKKVKKNVFFFQKKTFFLKKIKK